MTSRRRRTVSGASVAGIENVDETVDTGKRVRDEVESVAADPVGNNPVTRADDVQTEVDHLRRVSRFLDSSMRIPGTSYRFGADSVIGLVPVGADSVIGLVPVGGDVITAVFSVYIVYKAYLLGLPYGTVARMGVNIVLDTVVGSVPVIGDLLDVGWKANDRNVELLEEHGDDLGSGQRDKWFAIAVVATPILLVVVSVLAVLGLAFGLV